MPRIKFEGFAHLDVYARVGVGEAWRKGEVRDVSDSDASQLVRKYPEAFSSVSGALGAPPRTSAVESPEPRAAPGPLDALDLSVSALKEALAAGGLDAHLDELLAAEENGKTRQGAIRAIKARLEVVG